MTGGYQLDVGWGTVSTWCHIPEDREPFSAASLLGGGQMEGLVGERRQRVGFRFEELHAVRPPTCSREHFTKFTVNR